MHVRKRTYRDILTAWRGDSTHKTARNRFHRIAGREFDAQREISGHFFMLGIAHGSQREKIYPYLYIVAPYSLRIAPIKRFHSHRVTIRAHIENHKIAKWPLFASWDTKMTPKMKSEPVQQML